MCTVKLHLNYGNVIERIPATSTTNFFYHNTLRDNKMGYFVQVVRGNLDIALRTINRQQSNDGIRRLVRNAQNFQKPGEKRRMKKADSIRRYERQALYRNLRTV
eukprot:IDg1438t1